MKQLCHLFRVSRSGYYDHLRKGERMRRQQDQQLGQQVETLFHANRQAYDSPRLTDALRKQGIRCGKNRIRRLMKERGLRAVHKRRRQPRTTHSKHALPIAPNLLWDKPAPKTVNQHWVSDITYIATREGWLYLAGTLDCYSRRLVGWQTSASLDSEVLLSAARGAFTCQELTRDLIYHSDHGSQWQPIRQPRLPEAFGSAGRSAKHESAR